MKMSINQLNLILKSNFNNDFRYRYYCKVEYSNCDLLRTYNYVNVSLCYSD